MEQQANDPQASIGLHNELDGALRALESALAEAARAVSVVRGLLPRIAALSEAVGDLESAMNRARQRIAGEPGAQPQPTLSAVPPSRPPVDFPAASAEPEPPAEEATESERPPAAGKPSHCLRLDVNSKGGSLELKAVDEAVNENQSVIDVALLEYDGRNATLRVWIDSTADPEEVRAALLDSLERKLAGHQDAEVRLGFEQESAA